MQHFIGTIKIQQCENQSQKPNLRNTFPDLDYAMLGYDIIKCYPNSNGHDPGFTYQIVAADYSENKHTSDCRYNVQRSYKILLNYTSLPLPLSQLVVDLVHSVTQLAQVLYKQTSSDVSSGEKVYITSSAKCSYYSSKTDLTQPPPLHPFFYRWANSLERNYSTANLLKFVKYYGTHFPTSVV